MPHTFTRPSTPSVSVEKEPVDGSCSHCGASELRRYPVLSEGGWFIAVKCQACLESQSREPWGLSGSITSLSQQV